MSTSQLATVAITTFICTFGGLCIHHWLQNKNNLISKSKHKATKFWDKYHCDKNITKEWLANWDELKPFILEQLKFMKKSEIKILIIGNGLSKIPIYLFDEGYTNITITDISNKAINKMKKEYESSKYSKLKWKVLDCTSMKDINDNSFNIVFDKGVSDTLQFRRRSKQSHLLLQQTFNEISRILINENGKYFCITPRKKVPLLKLIKFNWSIKRIEIKKNIYLHICTKFNDDNNNIFNRRKQFEKGLNISQELKQLNLKFEPLIEIKDIDKDINKDIDSFYVLNGIIENKRKFGKKLIFYQVSLLNDKNKNKKLISVIAERSFVAKLSNPNLKKEFATNYLTQCGDQVIIYGKFGLTKKGILSLFVYYLSLIQYHPNWKHDT